VHGSSNICLPAATESIINETVNIGFVQEFPSALAGIGSRASGIPSVVFSIAGSTE
jgi:hypothetical protein